VVDVGSNDGTLLAAIKDHCRVLGVEPAEEISEQAREAGVPTVTAFFDQYLAQRIVDSHDHADVVTCVQTLQHIPLLADFMAGVRRLLAPDGVLVIEGRYWPATMRNNTYDTIYHEMLAYFSLHSLMALLVRQGLFIYKAVETPTYGGSLRVYASRLGESDNSVEEILNAERAAGVHKLQTHLDFEDRVVSLSLRLQELVYDLQAKGARIAGYGAPSTSTTLLGCCKIGGETIDYIVDDNPLKQGLYHPGTHIPIVSAQALEEHPPTHLLVLAGQFADVIMAKTKELGIKYILPVPPRVVDGL
jgi:SAM-dependent methyltransferase